MRKCVFSELAGTKTFIIIYTLNSGEAPLKALSNISPDSHGLYNSHLEFYGVIGGLFQIEVKVSDALSSWYLSNRKIVLC